MSNFGSRILGFFTSKGGGSAYQNLQQTLTYGNVTSNYLTFYQNDNLNLVKVFNDSFLITDSNLYQVLAQANLTQATKLIGSGEFTKLGTNNYNIQMGSVDIGYTTLVLNEPNLNIDMTLPKDNGTLGIRSMIFKSVDLSSGDVLIGDLGSGTEVFFNTIFYVTNGSNTNNLILSDSLDIADDVPFYICYANTDGLNVNIITFSGNPIYPSNPPTSGNGFITLVKSSFDGQYWCNGVA